MTTCRGVLAAVLFVAVAGCSNGSDGATPSDPSVATVTTTNDASVDSVNESAPGEPALTLSNAAPAAASVFVPSSAVTEDRVIRRGEQSEIQQGQMFVVDDATTLDSISFEVVAAEPVDSGESLALDLYVVGDPTSAVPSGFVDLGFGDDSLVLPLGEPLAPGVPTHVTFSFPAIELEPGRHYAAVLSLGGGASATVLYMQHAESDVYAEGLAIRFEGSNWKADRVVGDQAFALTLN